MFPSKALLSLILVCTWASAEAAALNRRTGKVTLNLSTKFNTNGGLNIPKMDRARAEAMKKGVQLGKRDGYSASAMNSVVNYHATVRIGSPPTSYTLLVDTGSANTWVGANNAYVVTSTSRDTGHQVSANYGTESFSGEEYTDTVTLSPELVISGQSIGVASSTKGIASGLDGILGVGPADLTEGTVDGVDTVPTVTDNLFSQGTITEHVLGVYFIPYPDSEEGELTFGGYDSSITTAPISYVQLTTTVPAAHYWGIDQSISYGGKSILSTTAGIVDTGTTGILLATDAFNQYKSLTGGVEDKATGLLKITSDQYNKLQTLTFNVGDSSFDLTPNGQIWPRSLNTAIGGDASAIYLVVTDIGSNSGSGYDFVNGYTFLERFYSVYDTTNQRVGLAPTKYTDSMSN